LSFYSTLARYKDFDFQDFFAKVTEERVDRALSAEKLSEMDFLALLSPLAAASLERMAQKAHELTVQYFGRTIQLYIPLYISNFCANECVYCGFHRGNVIHRKKLTMAEIEAEAQARWPLEASLVIHRFGRLEPGAFSLRIPLRKCLALEGGQPRLLVRGRLRAGRGRFGRRERLGVVLNGFPALRPRKRRGLRVRDAAGSR